MDIESLLSKTLEISKGVICNIHQSLLKEWGSESLGVLPEDTIQQLLTGVIVYFSSPLHFSLTCISTYHVILFISDLPD